MINKIVNKIAVVFYAGNRYIYDKLVTDPTAVPNAIVPTIYSKVHLAQTLIVQIAVQFWCLC